MKNIWLEASAQVDSKRVSKLERKARAGRLTVHTNRDRDLLLETGRWTDPQQVTRLYGAGQTWMLTEA